VNARWRRVAAQGRQGVQRGTSCTAGQRQTRHSSSGESISIGISIFNANCRGGRKAPLFCSCVADREFSAKGVRPAEAWAREPGWLGGAAKRARRCACRCALVTSLTCGKNGVRRPLRQDTYAVQSLRNGRRVHCTAFFAALSWTSADTVDAALFICTSG
jgi:hypothetical protein